MLSLGRGLLWLSPGVKVFRYSLLEWIHLNLEPICVHHGDFYIKVTGMLVGKLDINPLRETNVCVAQA